MPIIDTDVPALHARLCWSWFSQISRVCMTCGKTAASCTTRHNAWDFREGRLRVISNVYSRAGCRVLVSAFACDLPCCLPFSNPGQGACMSTDMRSSVFMPGSTERLY